MSLTAAYPSTPCPVAPYVPHRGDICLLERLLEVNDDYLLAEVIPTENNLFARPQGIPAWVGIEWLAQAVSAWAGVQSALHNQAPQIGFLLGTRRYRCDPLHFAFNQPVRAQIIPDFRADNGLGAFNGCLLDAEGNQLAVATLSVYEPPNADALQALQKGEKP
ncbi:ApeP family dehydratase [Halopseudomonas salegens]|uniref:Predicted 3-hydroxylacyl-ACP dehydratase, HotDog domain n=1 Tax=Halopseudomonas salegens TaxID=1434072 RepID=A0A1H2GWT8_9GAMM|nr:hypothetical protein [Halopseudomonas salegens]SDU24042.1 Predicted 3-hydroxylacyl-ACP dehydratase, HotDog domain [Halopseudomonas salegens]